MQKNAESSLLVQKKEKRRFSEKWLLKVKIFEKYDKST